MTYTNIDEIIFELETIIENCVQSNSRIGYFAILYLKVTCRVKEEISKKSFQDCIRMEKLDIVFAQRFIEAYYSWKKSEQVTASWEIVFRTATLPQPIVIQHLLLGINAHINLDLGIATVETMQNDSFQNIRQDFNSINNILNDMISKVEENLGKVSPAIRLLNLHKKNYDEMLVQFSIKTAREGAWIFATELAGKTGKAYVQCIAERDKKISYLGNCISFPGKWLHLTLKIIRIFEWRQPSEIIRILRIV
ncbi:DUF5995 family protein [Daejeonella oryzae]|uniref:DUF5995 family protein n=1 Tax=Daejeonella oryzae TaxID=1122943 RepID=UPI000400703D|nr:DUF5995 family protein [Daejeonella oryzae]